MSAVAPAVVNGGTNTAVESDVGQRDGVHRETLVDREETTSATNNNDHDDSIVSNQK